MLEEDGECAYMFISVYVCTVISKKKERTEHCAALSFFYLSTAQVCIDIIIHAFLIIQKSHAMRP